MIHIIVGLVFHKSILRIFVYVIYTWLLMFRDYTLWFLFLTYLLLSRNKYLIFWIILIQQLKGVNNLYVVVGLFLRLPEKEITRQNIITRLTKILNFPFPFLDLIGFVVFFCLSLLSVTNRNSESYFDVISSFTK